MEINLSHDEVERLCSAADPTEALIALIPSGGPVIAAGPFFPPFTVALRYQDKKSGGKGAIIMVRIAGTPGLFSLFASSPIWIRPPKR